RFVKHGVDTKELADAQKGYLKQMKLQWTGNSRLASYLADGLYEGRTFAFYAELQKKIEALTPQDVSAAFRKHIYPKRLVIIPAGDFKRQESTPRKAEK